MIKSKKLAALFCAGVIAIGASQQASAAFASGDLIMSFYATGGTGVGTTVIANLGTGVSYRDSTSSVSSVIDIGSTLSSTYGGSWFDRTDVLWNIVGVRANLYSAPSPGVVNGDTRSTIYASRARPGASNASLYDFTSGNSLLTPSTTITGYNSTAATALASANSATVPTTTANTIEDYAPGTGWFGLFSADFAQSFGTGTVAGGFEGALDLQRLIPSNTTSGAHAGNIVVPGVNAGDGSFEGTFTISNTGVVGYAAVPEPSTIALLGLGLGAGLFGYRRRQKQQN